MPLKQYHNNSHPVIYILENEITGEKIEKTGFKEAAKFLLVSRSAFYKHLKTGNTLKGFFIDIKI